MFQSRNHQTDTNRHCPGSAFARTEQHWAALSSTEQHCALSCVRLPRIRRNCWCHTCNPGMAAVCGRMRPSCVAESRMNSVETFWWKNIPPLSVENSFTTCSALLRLALDTIVALCLILGMATQPCTTTHPVFWRPLLKCGFRMKFCPQPRPAPYFFLAALQHESQVTPMRFKQELCISSSLLTWAVKKLKVWKLSVITMPHSERYSNRYETSIFTWNKFKKSQQQCLLCFNLCGASRKLAIQNRNETQLFKPVVVAQRILWCFESFMAKHNPNQQTRRPDLNSQSHLCNTIWQSWFKKWKNKEILSVKHIPKKTTETTKTIGNTFPKSWTRQGHPWNLSLVRVLSPPLPGLHQSILQSNLLCYLLPTQAEQESSVSMQRKDWLAKKIFQPIHTTSSLELNHVWCLCWIIT